MPDAEIARHADESLEERLEQGGVVEYPTSPFALPTGDDLQFLLTRELSSAGHKNISYTPRTGRARGFRQQGTAADERLRSLLASFANSLVRWLTATFPRYAAASQPDQVTYRPQEEAVRRLRLTARNDLLHVDAFPSRPTGGWRILRVFANVNPAEPRVWVTSDPFARLLARYGKQAGLPGLSSPGIARRLLQIFHPKRSEYDSFMLRLHDYLKANDEFQTKCVKRIWNFQPGSVWMAMTDACSHAVLRGRFALEHSFFVPPHGLVLPEESPAALLARAVGRPVLRAAG